MKESRRDLRSLGQNALEHIIFREILNHLLANDVKLPAGEAGEKLIKELTKTTLGLKIKVNGIEINKPTALYKTDEMADFITRVACWASHDLNLYLEI